MPVLKTVPRFLQFFLAYHYIATELQFKCPWAVREHHWAVPWWGTGGVKQAPGEEDRARSEAPHSVGAIGGFKCNAGCWHRVISAWRGVRAALPALLMKNHELGALKWRGLRSCGTLAAFNLHAVA